MKQQRKDPFQEEIRRERIAALKKAVVPILFAIGLMLLLWYLASFATKRAAQPGLAQKGLVVRFGSTATDTGDQPLMLVRLQDGSTRELRVARAQLQTCRAGDSIRLIRKGEHVSVHPRACLRDAE